MSITYTDNRPSPAADRFDPAPRPVVRDERPFVPVYARTGRDRVRKGGVRAWMILAPIGVLLVGGAVLATMAYGGREAPADAPVLEPAATAPVLPATAPLTAAAQTPVEAVPVEATPAPAPVARREAAPVRRAAPAPVRETAPATAVRTPAPATATLNTAPTPVPAAAEPPPPAIVVAPLN